MLANLWEKFGEPPVLFQHDNASVHKARSLKKWFSTEEFDWAAQSSDPNPIQQLECQLQSLKISAGPP